MRPRKKILCVDSDEQDLSVLSFTLHVNGYNPIPATNLDEAVACFVRWPIDLCLVSYRLTGTDGASVIERLKRINRHVPMLLLAEPREVEGRLNLADAAVSKRHCTASDLLERIRIMIARKRGPRKGSHHSAIPASIDSVSPSVDGIRA